MPFDDSTFYRNGEEPGRWPYLKCVYGCPQFDDYVIGFTTTESKIEETPIFPVRDGEPSIKPNGFGNHMWVNGKDIITLDEDSGLVKLFGFEKIGGGNCLISIRDSAKGNTPSRRNVPESEIVWR